MAATRSRVASPEAHTILSLFPGRARISLSSKACTIGWLKRTDHSVALSMSSLWSSTADQARRKVLALVAVDPFGTALPASSGVPNILLQNRSSSFSVGRTRAQNSWFPLNSCQSCKRELRFPKSNAQSCSKWNAFSSLAIGPWSQLQNHR